MNDVMIQSCECGSGLPTDKCCGRELSALVGVTVCSEAVATILRQAVDRFNAGDQIAAGAACIGVLMEEPLLVPALHLLADIRNAERAFTAELALRRRIVAAMPRDFPQTVRFATALIEQGDKDEAVARARRGVWMLPEDPRANWLMALAFSQVHRAAEAEYHFDRALAASKTPKPELLLAFADHLRRNGQLDKARDILRQAESAGAMGIGALALAIMVAEFDGKLDEAEAIIARAMELAPANPVLCLPRATVAARRRDYEGALAILESYRPHLAPEASVPLLMLRGRIQGELGRTDEAFADFAAGKALELQTARRDFHPERVDAMVTETRRVFTPLMMSRLPRAPTRADVMQPLFITGFPRSGTTMVEQTLSMHPRIAAGGELGALHEVLHKARGLLGSSLNYPGALQELVVADRRHGLTMMRDDYLNNALPNVTPKAGAVWFTDKALQREAHIPLMSLLFPASAIINVVRHPLDSILSVFSLQLPDSLGYSLTLEKAAHFYRQNAEAAEQWRLTLPSVRLLTIRYEDILADQEAEVARMLAFIGEPYDPACLDFHKNKRVPATLSYSQVRGKISNDRKYRYKRYLKQLAPVIPVLEPVIAMLGYAIEET
jgi:Tfp pilus assembly protein PilF